MVTLVDVLKFPVILFTVRLSTKGKIIDIYEQRTMFCGVSLIPPGFKCFFLITYLE